MEFDFRHSNIFIVFLPPVFDCLKIIHIMTKNPVKEVIIATPAGLPARPLPLILEKMLSLHNTINTSLSIQYYNKSI